MKAIVTGAGGFMGSHLFEYLFHEPDWQVIGFDNYSLGTYRHPNIYDVELTRDELIIDDFIEKFKPDVIYHLAAWAHEGLSSFSPRKILKNNFNAYINVLIPAIKHKVKRIVFVSSMSVYGDQTPPFDEGMPRKPVDIYGLAKSSCEQTTEILAKVHGFEYVIVRPHNVYGERQNMSDPYRNVVAIFINQCLRGKPMYIYGDGKQKRAFSYIDDVTPSIYKAGLQGEGESISGQICNVGARQEYTVLELAAEIKKHFPQATTKHVAQRPLEIKDAYCTSDLAETILGFSPHTSFSEGIATMIQWAKKVGASVPKYLDELELETKDTPKTWTQKLI